MSADKLSYPINSQHTNHHFNYTEFGAIIIVSANNKFIMQAQIKKGGNHD